MRPSAGRVPSAPAQQSPIWATPQDEHQHPTTPLNTMPTTGNTMVASANTITATAIMRPWRPAGRFQGFRTTWLSNLPAPETRISLASISPSTWPDPEMRTSSKAPPPVEPDPEIFTLPGCSFHIGSFLYSIIARR